MSKTIIICGFPGIGKSYYAANSNMSILDLDSSSFSKGGSYKEFPYNYLEAIKSNIGKVDIILVSSHLSVRCILAENNLNPILIYPQLKLKEEYLQRFKLRGSTPEFIHLVNSEWEDWHRQIKILYKGEFAVLGPGQYLSDLDDIFRNILAE